MCADGLALPQLVSADDIQHIEDEEALNILEDTLKPQKYDPLDFWNHIQSRVNKLPYDLTISL